MVSALFFLLGISVHFIYQRIRLGKFETLATKIIHQAEIHALEKGNRIEAALKEKQALETKTFEAECQSQELKLLRREESLNERSSQLEKKAQEFEKTEHLQKKMGQELEAKTLEVNKRLENLSAEWEKLSGMTLFEAKELLLVQAETNAKQQKAEFIRRHHEEAIMEAEVNAAKIIAGAIQRIASRTTSEVTASTVSLPSEELKGRIIGREGRNIRALEKATGVSFIMDDTPQAIVISSYDPLRRHIAKLALTDLIADGRIHPTSIEEATEKAKKTTDAQVKKFGEDAAFRIGVFNFHPEIILLLGKLNFRHSLGQNVLTHSLEVAHLMGIMAEELGLNGELARRIGLLHDMGKAVSHEIPGTHALIGQDLALKYGESQKVANGIGCHHFEIDPITIEGSLCSAADAISASLPGARLGSIEQYVKRLRSMEDLALSYPGVEKAYALQAGKELRVVILPEAVSEDDMTFLAKNLTGRIQKELDYPGKIKVTLMREKRVIDYAM